MSEKSLKFHKRSHPNRTRPHLPFSFGYCNPLESSALTKKFIRFTYHQHLLQHRVSAAAINPEEVGGLPPRFQVVLHRRFCTKPVDGWCVISFELQAKQNSTNPPSSGSAETEQDRGKATGPQLLPIFKSISKKSHMGNPQLVIQPG